MTRATRLSRRRFLQGSLLAAAGSAIAACDPSATSPPTASVVAASPTAPGAEPDPTPNLGVPSGPLTFANRAGAIDMAEDRLTSPTLVAFEEAYDVRVDYAGGEIEDDEAFVATLRPQLEAGVEPGWDLIAVADWMAARLVAQGWAQRIDPTNTPAARANLRDEHRGRAWDPDNSFHYPWIASAAGIAYAPDAAGRPLTGLADLFDPAFAGKVTLLPDARETLALVHLLLRDRNGGVGRRADEMTVDDARAATDFLRPYVASGHVRAFTDRDVGRDLADGASAVAMARTRDVVGAVGNAVAFVWPREGSLRWTDDMLIPLRAKHETSAQLLIDWVYEPLHAARITAAVGGISPVRGVPAAIAELEGAPDPESPAYPLLFPTPGTIARQHQRPAWDEATEAEIGALFAELTRGVGD